MNFGKNDARSVLRTEVDALRRPLSVASLMSVIREHPSCTPWCQGTRCSDNSLVDSKAAFELQAVNFAANLGLLNKPKLP